MGITHLERPKIQDSSKHSAMQITLLVNIAAELHAVRVLLEDITSLAPGQKDSAEKILAHSQHAFASHSEDLIRDLDAVYK